MSSAAQISVGKNNGDIQKIFKVIKRHKLMILLTTLLFLIGGAFYNYMATPVYESEATVKVSKERLDLRFTSVIRAMGLDTEASLIDTEIEILKSRNLIDKAIDAVNYNVRYFTKNGLKKEELYKNAPFKVENLIVKDPIFYNRKFIVKQIDANTFLLQTKDSIFSKIKDKIVSLFGTPKPKLIYKEVHKFGEKIDNDYFSLTINKIKDFKNGYYYFFSQPKYQLIQQINDNLDVFSATKNAAVIKLVFDDTNPLRAKDFLDNLTREYLEQTVSQKTSEASKALAFIEDQLKKVSKKLKESAIKLENFKEENNIVDVGIESDVTLKKLSKLESELNDLTLKENNLKIIYEEFQKGNYSAISSLSADYPVIEKMLTDLISKINKKNELLVDFTENHPDVIKVSSQIEELKRALEDTIESMYESVKEKKKSLEDIIYTQETGLMKLPEKERVLADLKRKYLVNEKTYSYLLEKQAEMSINKAATVSSNKILDYANMPHQPIKPVKLFVLSASGLLGLIFGFLGAFIRDYFDTKIKTKEDIYELTKLPIFGVVPYVRDANKLFVLEDPQSLASESIRTIRTNLDFVGASRKDKSKVVVVTSVVPGEGKTTIAANLAATLGNSEKKTIILSLDLRRPKLHRIFNLSNKSGMSTVLAGKDDLKDVIWEHQTIKNLDIVTSGPIPPNPSDLIDSSIMQEVFEILRRDYDYIIIDSPPVSSVTDAIILMKNADVSLSVFMSEYSEKDYVKNLNEMVEMYGLKHIGIVLNGVKAKYLPESFSKYNYLPYK